MSNVQKAPTITHLKELIIPLIEDGNSIALIALGEAVGARLNQELRSGAGGYSRLEWLPSDVQFYVTSSLHPEEIQIRDASQNVIFASVNG